jgi:hypothetical protein
VAVSGRVNVERTRIMTTFYGATGALLAGLLAIPLATATPAAAQAKTQIGVLRCNVSGGIGLIVTSKKSMVCRFQPSKGRIERYSGSIRKFGLDIGATKRGVIGWAVFAPSRGYRRGALAGDYVGASGEAALGAGGGANVLVGGGERSISLQPLSVSAQVGVNLALGVANLTLRSIR